MYITDCIVGFAYPPRKDNIGTVNPCLAQNILAFIHHELKGIPAPLLLQQELAHYAVTYRAMTKVIDEKLEERLRFSPLRVCSEAREEMRRNGWKTCVIAAQEKCLALRMWLMQRLGAEVVGTVSVSGCDPHAVRMWAWHPALLVPRERWLRLAYKAIGVDESMTPSE